MEYEDAINKLFEQKKKLMARQSHSFAKATLKELKNTGGVYAISDKSGTVIYVGRSGRLRSRLLGDHRSGDVVGSQFRRALMEGRSLTSEKEITLYITGNCSFKFLEIANLEEQIRLEHFITAVVGPELNVKLKR
jgi:hypothetical protein